MKHKYTESVMREIIEEKTSNEYSLLYIEHKGQFNKQTAKTEKRKMTIKHNICGHIYTLDIYEFSKGKRRCGKCKGKVLREHFVETLDSIKVKTQKLTKGEYEFVDNCYINSKYRHNYLHHACKTIFDKSWDKFRIGQRCTNCQRKGMDSRASRYVRDILDTFIINYECEKLYNDCRNPKTNKLLRFDYYIQDINLLIEVDGEQHERDSFGKENFKECKFRDNIKTEYAKKQNITLIRIPAKGWIKIPTYMQSIISQCKKKTIPLKEIESVKHSTHVERINKDLQKIKEGAYVLIDNFYMGVDREHNYKHIICGKTFIKTYSRIKTDPIPCTKCSKKEAKKRSHQKLKKALESKSSYRYTLDDSKIGITDKKKRLVRCNKCKKSWESLVTNIMQDNGGCQNCKKINLIKKWRLSYHSVIEHKKLGKQLNRGLYNWLYHNRRKYKNGTIEKWKARLLTKENLL